MRLDTHLSQRMDQRMILAPRMIQSMEILQLPIMALQERIQQELQENPVLEIQEKSEEETEEGEGETAVATATQEEDDPADRTQELVIDEKGDNELDFDRLDALYRDWEDHFNEEHRPSRNGLDEEGDKKHDAMQNMPSRPQSLHDYLGDQIAFLDVDAETSKLFKHVISYIDDHGYLKTAVEDIAQQYEGGVVTTAQVEEAIKMIQKLDPPGVGARSTKECLLLQITD